MIPALFYLCLCGLSGYGIVRLGMVMDRLEDAQRERILAAIQGAPVPAWPTGFLSDFIGAVLLCLLFVGCIILASTNSPH